MTEIEPINSPSSKTTTPITLLQEICSRNGLNPEYQLLSTEGTVHEPTFKIAVTVGDINVTASGQSKKKARHAAARRAIEELKINKPDLIGTSVDLSILPADDESSAGGKVITTYAKQSETNPVGKLQEICMKMRVNPPDYETCNEKGLAHERVFVLSCKIASLNLTTLGEGRSKKLAKREAAENMLSKLDSSEIYDDKTSNVKSNSETNASSLYLDNDDFSHFVKTRCVVQELCAALDCGPKYLLDDINLILNDDINEDLFYNLIQETAEKIGHCLFNWITDAHCILNIYAHDDRLILSSFGFGLDNTSAMKQAVIHAFKLMICSLEPLKGMEDLNPSVPQDHRVAAKSRLTCVPS